MNFKTAYSTQNTVKGAIADLKQQLEGISARFILYFASSYFDPHHLSKQMGESFPKSTLAGCTTAGEIISGQMLDKSIVAMAFTAEVITDVKVELLANIKTDEVAVQKAFSSFEKYFKTPMIDLDYKKYVGVILTDGLSGCEEKVMDKIGDLTNVTFIGGSTGDDLQFKQTYVFANGKAYSNAAVLILLKPVREFHILKTQSFTANAKKLVVTSSEESQRKVIEFNHKPATVAYAEALGVEEKDLSKYIFKNPLGLMAENGEPFVRSPRLIEQQAMYFYCSMKEGMELSLLHSTDIVKDTKASIKKKEQEIGKISAVINFNCILRTLDLKEQNLTKEYGDLFKDIPTIGFSTYGESYIGHINQTSTMLVFN